MAHSVAGSRHVVVFDIQQSLSQMCFFWDVRIVTVDKFTQIPELRWKMEGDCCLYGSGIV